MGHPQAKLTPADREAIVACVQSGLRSNRAVADEFGVSRERVRQLVRAAEAAERAEIAVDLELAALRLRYERGLELAHTVSEPERFRLLVAVIAPSRDLLEASRQAALERLNGEPATLRRSYGNCSGCGVPLADRTAGCRVCRERDYGRRKRRRQRDARQTQAA